MDSKFTKGEWIVESSHHYSGEYSLKTNKGAPTFGEDKANATLIAASPDLLELALLVYNSFGGGRVITFSDRDIEQFKNTIEKALTIK